MRLVSASDAEQSSPHSSPKKLFLVEAAPIKDPDTHPTRTNPANCTRAHGIHQYSTAGYLQYASQTPLLQYEFRS